MTLERNHMPHALVRARHHSDSMRWRRHVESAKRGALSTLQIARPGRGYAIRARGATHCVHPQLGEMWIKALERGEGAPRDMRAGVAKVNHSLRCCRK